MPVGRCPAIGTAANFCTVLGIASAGRASTLLETVNYISGMLSGMCPIVVCVPRIEDAAGIADRADVELLIGPHGLTRQRNTILRAVSGKADLLIFLDDDFIPMSNFVTRMQDIFLRQPDVVIATGDVIADGILGKGLSMSEAMEVIGDSENRAERVTEVYNAYGCNMAVRLSTVSQHNILFDEELPLYAWLEDVDFSRSMARYGKSVHVGGACGVHLGARSGRQPGVRLGYSQVANPAYLRKKGTMATSRAIMQIVRNLIANIGGFCLGDGSVDRRGRLRGNLIALGDLLQGRASPSRIMEFATSPTQKFTAASIAENRKEQL
ncbi:glycosyltransferase (plasmid) [Rhizobium sp. RCAM05350]|nr:glycosyltransferase [Rhizobium sp. RCAM05350]